MRLFRATSFILGLALTAALPMGATANSDAANQLAQIEAGGLKSADSQRLMTMFAQPQATAVQFSRSWLDAQPKANGSEQWRCLTEALYFEARGETVEGQFAVAEVIMNRVKSARFPGSFCAVVNQGTGKRNQCQFSYTCDGHKEVIAERQAYARVGKVARAVIDGKAPKLTDGATHYHTTAVKPRWSRVFTRTARIGVHLFYRNGYQTASN